MNLTEQILKNKKSIIYTDMVLFFAAVLIGFYMFFSDSYSALLYWISYAFLLSSLLLSGIYERFTEKPKNNKIKWVFWTLLIVIFSITVVIILPQYLAPYQESYYNFAYLWSFTFLSQLMGIGFILASKYADNVAVMIQRE